MTNFVKLAATAKRLIEKDGRSVTLFKLNRTPTDAAKPWRGNSAAPDASEGGAEFTATIAFVPASGSGFGKMIVDAGGSLAVAYDQVGLLAADSVTAGLDVAKFNKLRDGDTIWSIVTRGHLRPGNKSILWLLGLKR